MKMNTKRWLVGGGLLILMLPFFLVGVIAQLVGKYVVAGWECMGVLFDELEKWVNK